MPVNLADFPKLELHGGPLVDTVTVLSGVHAGSSHLDRGKIQIAVHNCLLPIFQNFIFLQPDRMACCLFNEVVEVEDEREEGLRFFSQ